MPNRDDTGIGWFSVNEAAILALLFLILAAWFYYQDVHLHKHELRRSRAWFFLLAAIISYPLMLVAFPYFDSIQAQRDPDKLSIVAFALVALAAAGIGMVIAHRWEASKREDLLQVARRLGFSYDPEGKIPLPAGLLKVPTFNSITGGVSHVLRGKGLDHESAIFEHDFSVGDDTRRHTIAAYRTSCLIPAFELRPENVLDKLVTAAGGVDVDFSEHPTFSSAYRLLCEDEDQGVIRRMFAGGLCTLFEREQGWTVGGQGHWVGLYKHLGLVDSEDVQKFYEKTKGIAKAIESAARSVAQ
jgi:hypothetical protein